MIFLSSQFDLFVLFIGMKDTHTAKSMVSAQVKPTLCALPNNASCVEHCPQVTLEGLSLWSTLRVVSED
jgi:hypothetical protein